MIELGIIITIGVILIPVILDYGIQALTKKTHFESPTIDELVYEVNGHYVSIYAINWKFIQIYKNLLFQPIHNEKLLRDSLYFDTVEDAKDYIAYAIKPSAKSYQYTSEHCVYIKDNMTYHADTYKHLNYDIKKSYTSKEYKRLSDFVQIVKYIETKPVL